MEVSCKKKKEGILYHIKDLPLNFSFFFFPFFSCQVSLYFDFHLFLNFLLLHSHCILSDLKCSSPFKKSIFVKDSQHLNENVTLDTSNTFKSLR